MQTAVRVVGEESEMRDIVLARVGPPPPPAGTSRMIDPHSLPAPVLGGAHVSQSWPAGLLDYHRARADQTSHLQQGLDITGTRDQNQTGTDTDCLVSFDKHSILE